MISSASVSPRPVSVAPRQVTKVGKGGQYQTKCKRFIQHELILPSTSLNLFEIRPWLWHASLPSTAKHSKALFTMVNSHSSYPFIREKLEEYCLKLMEFPECSYWIHEKVVADFIGIGRSDEFGQSKLLSSLLACVKNGHGGKRRNKNSFKLTGVNMVDLTHENNGSRVCCQGFGLREEFQGGILATEPDFRIPRWFKFGNQCQPKVCTQLIVANELIGNCNVSFLSAADPGVIPKFALKRRRQSYANFFKSKRGECVPYRNYDIPVIIKNCIHLWPDIKTALPDDFEEREPRRRTFSPEHLDRIEEDLRLLLVVSNKIGKLEVRRDVLRASRST